MLGSQINNELGNIVIREIVAEGGHFFASEDELVFDLLVGPLLLKSPAYQGRSFFCADATFAMAVFAAGGAIEVCAGLQAGLFVVGVRVEREKQDAKAEREGELHHSNIFA